MFSHIVMVIILNVLGQYGKSQSCSWLEFANHQWTSEGSSVVN
jgi:hypothetical protein